MKWLHFAAIIVLALLASTLAVGATTAALPTNQSIAYYLKVLNNNLVFGTAQTTASPPATTGGGTVITITQNHLNVECINKILLSYQSPAAGTGSTFIQYAELYKIDPGMALAFFQNESSFGKSGEGARNKSIGNRKDLSGNYLSYSTWEEGVKEWFAYMDRKYIQQGKTTLEEIMPIYMNDNPDIPKEIADIKGYFVSYPSKC